MRDNSHFTARFSAMWRLLSAPAQARQDPGVRGGFANTVGEKATCDRRNRHRLIAWAMAAVFALAGSAATAESPLTGENAKELARLLAVPAQKIAVSCSDRTGPHRAPLSALSIVICCGTRSPSTRRQSTIRGIQQIQQILVSASSSVRLGRAMRWQSCISPCSMPKML